MKLVSRLLPLLVLALCAVLLLVQGCTLHFKASEVELDSVGNRTYELDRLAVLHE